MKNLSNADRYNKMHEAINLATEAKVGAILLSAQNGGMARLAMISSALNTSGIETLVISTETLKVIRDEQIDLSAQMEDGKILLAVTPEDRETQYMNSGDAVIALMDNRRQSAYAYSIRSYRPALDQNVSIETMLNEGIAEMVDADNTELSIIPVDAYDPREPDRAAAAHPSLPTDDVWRIHCEHLSLSKNGSETVDKAAAINALKDQMSKEGKSALAYTLSLGCIDVASMANGRMTVIEYDIAKSHDARVAKKPNDRGM